MKDSFWALPVNKLNWNPWYYWISRNVRDWTPHHLSQLIQVRNAMSAFPAERLLSSSFSSMLHSLRYDGSKAGRLLTKSPSSPANYSIQAVWQSVAQREKNCVMNIQKSCNRTRFSKFPTPKPWQWTPPRKYVSVFAMRIIRDRQSDLLYSVAQCSFGRFP